MIVVGNVLQRLVHVGFGDIDLVLVGFLELQDFIFERAQHLGADLGQGLFGRPNS